MKAPPCVKYTQEPGELLEIPESLQHHSVAGNGERDGSKKRVGLGNQQPSPSERWERFND
jgi:hypothetical protein